MNYGTAVRRQYPAARPLNRPEAQRVRHTSGKRPAFELYETVPTPGSDILCRLDGFFGECLGRLILENGCDNDEIMALGHCLSNEEIGEYQTFEVFDSVYEQGTNTVCMLNVDLAICLGNYLVDVITETPPPSDMQPNRNPGIPAIMAFGNRLANLKP